MILLKFTLKKVYGIGNRCKALITNLRGGGRGVGCVERLEEVNSLNG